MFSEGYLLFLCLVFLYSRLVLEVALEFLDVSLQSLMFSLQVAVPLAMILGLFLLL